MLVRSRAFLLKGGKAFLSITGAKLLLIASAALLLITSHSRTLRMAMLARLVSSIPTKHSRRQHTAVLSVLEQTDFC